MTLDLGVVDVQAVLKDAITTVQMEVDEKRLSLVSEFSPQKLVVRGDLVRLRQIFWNVLKNAVRFTPECGKIMVRSAPSADGTEAVISVTDTGMGMTEEELARVFEAFTQGEHAEHSRLVGHHFGGLGLGLAISRRLVELHRGEIRAESPGRGRGATFSILLPLEEQTKAAGADKTSPAHLGSTKVPHGIRILLVEDHEPTRRALEQLLIRRQYQVETAASLGEARALAKKSEFQLLISDIGLPDGDGYALMMELGRDRRIKGIALTGYGMEHDVAFSQSAGFVAHLTKPVRVESLESALAVALSEG
jgi:CheY-like chemotaxis protein